MEIKYAIAWSKGDNSGNKWYVIIVGVIVFLWLLESKFLNFMLRCE